MHDTERVFDVKARVTGGARPASGTLPHSPASDRDGATSDGGSATREARPLAVRRARSVAPWASPRSCRSPAGRRPTPASCWRSCATTRTPAARKALLAGAAGYLVLGRDLIPDDIPVLGGLDDLVVVVLAVDLFLDGVPSDLLDEKLDELGIDRAAFEQDVAQVRRLTPRPVRRAIRQLPQAAAAAGRAIRSSRSRAARAVLDHQGGFLRVKVILTNDVAKLGKSGEMKTVADGFATNFLIPHQLAVPGRRRRLPRLAARHRQPRGQAHAASARRPRSPPTGSPARP